MINETDAIGTSLANGTTNDTVLLECGEVVTQCGCYDAEYARISETLQWWCEGVLFFGVGLIALVFNTLSIGILATEELRKHTFNQLLIAHSLIDIGFIVVSLPVYTYNLLWQVDTKTWFGEVFIRMYVTTLYPLSAVMLCASVYMTVAITIERYLAVCRPIFYRNITRTMKSAKRVTIYVTPVLLVSGCLNIPKFMETQTSGGSSGGDQENGTSTANSTEGIQVTAADIRLDPTYMLYYTISQIFHPTLTTGIGPMVALIFMNTSIYYGIRKTVAARNQRRATTAPIPSQIQNNGQSVGNLNQLAVNQNDGLNMRRPSDISQNIQHSAAVSLGNSPRPAVNRDNRKTEANLAFVLIGITTMHLVCHALRVFLAAYAVYLNSTWVNCMKTEGSFLPPLWTMCAEHISSILMMLNLAGNFLIYCSVLKPFKAYLASKCGCWTQCWTKLFRSISEYVSSIVSTARNGDIGSSPAPNLVTIKINATTDSGDAECPEESPLMDGQRQHKNTPNGAANTCEVSPLLPDEGVLYVNEIDTRHSSLSSVSRGLDTDLSTSDTKGHQPRKDGDITITANPNELCNPPLNEPLATPDKPQVCHPSGFDSSLRLEENKVSANNGRDLSSLSRKTNEDGKEDASPQCNGDQNNSKAGSQNDKRKENKKSSKSEMCTTKCEDDLIDDQDGMQQLLVESEGGTVLFQSTNVTILPPGATSNNGRHLYENRSCEVSSNNVSSQTAPGPINGVKRSSKKVKRDGFSQT